MLLLVIITGCINVSFGDSDTDKLYDLFAKDVDLPDDDVIIDLNGNGEYAITKYKIDIIVNKDNSYFITEQITAYFLVQKHGIYRNIPLENQIDRLNNSKSFNKAQISKISVASDQYTDYKEIIGNTPKHIIK